MGHNNSTGHKPVLSKMSIASRRTDVSRQHLERRRFTRSIDSEKSEAFTLVNANRDLVNCQMALARQTLSVHLLTHTDNKHLEHMRILKTADNAEYEQIFVDGCHIQKIFVYLNADDDN